MGAPEAHRERRSVLETSIAGTSTTRSRHRGDAEVGSLVLGIEPLDVLAMQVDAIGRVGRPGDKAQDRSRGKCVHP